MLVPRVYFLLYQALLLFSLEVKRILFYYKHSEGVVVDSCYSNYAVGGVEDVQSVGPRASSIVDNLRDHYFQCVVLLNRNVFSTPIEDVAMALHAIQRLGPISPFMARAVFLSAVLSMPDADLRKQFVPDHGFESRLLADVVDSFFYGKGALSCVDGKAIKNQLRALEEVHVVFKQSNCELLVHSKEVLSHEHFFGQLRSLMVDWEPWKPGLLVDTLHIDLFKLRT